MWTPSSPAGSFKRFERLDLHRHAKWRLTDESEEILRQIQEIIVMDQGGFWVLHKPLLLVIALGRMLAGHERLRRYEDLGEPLKDLLNCLGPSRRRALSGSAIRMAPQGRYFGSPKRRAACS